jgi:hypothetical protein
MSDLAWPLAVVTLGLISGWVAVTWLNLRAQEALNRLQRDERETGAFAKMRARMDEIEGAFGSMRTEQKTFLANARSR